MQEITGRMFETINHIADGAKMLTDRVSNITGSADSARTAIEEAAHSAERTGACAERLDKLISQFRVSGV